MHSLSRNRWLVGAALIAAMGLTWSALQAQFELASDFSANERVASIAVRIDVGGEGAELNEPVALDLGLGFPLWLHPLGRVEGEAIPFGAIPQSATVVGPVAAGSGATYTFSLEGEPGQDRLRATPQLLDGVQVSDISRIGFVSPGGADWTLAGYELQINGRVFAAHAGINLSVQEAHEGAELRQAELDLSIGPLETEQAELQGLVEAELATADDTERLADIRTTLVPLRAERQRLAAQLAGAYPWFEEAAFVSPWRTGAVVSRARVSLITDTHPGADTRNPVYFRTGGHKYALSGAEHALTGETGPQTFEIDLLAGPLTAPDLRGYAVGMLGHDGLNGTAPDRWHPRRVMVEVDGSVVYDSDSSEVDRLSLEAIRLVPPAHLAPDGSLVVNRPIARETFVWQAGSGAGLDLLAGGAATLPAVDDPAYPAAESGLEGGSGGDVAMGEDMPLFPGEMGPGWGPGWGPGGWEPDWGPGLPWWPPGMAPPGWGEWMWWFPGMWDGLVGGLLADLFDDIHPLFEPFQVDDVQITNGWREGDVYTVNWEVTGNAGEIADFTVQLLPVHPHDDPHLIGPPVAVALHVPAGARSCDLPVPVGGDEFLYLEPVVTAWPAHALLEHDTTTGPAQPVFPLATPAGIQPLPPVEFSWMTGGIFGGPAAIQLGGSPPAFGRASWYFAGAPGQIDLNFGNPAPGYNLALRPAAGDDLLYTSFGGGTVTGAYRVVANVGFLGGTDAVNSATFHIYASLSAGGMFQGYPVVDQPVAVAPGPPTPMPLMTLDVDSADVGGGPAELTIIVWVEGGDGDIDHPPAFFGLRAVPQ